MLQSADPTTVNSLFRSELVRFGPRDILSAHGVLPSEGRQASAYPSADALSLTEAEKYCRMWARRQYENFTVVSFLLPRRIQQDFFNIYAFCRWSDDLADEIHDRSLSLQLLEWWEDQLTFCPKGESSHPVMIALGATIEEYDLPLALFTDLLVAFKQDQARFRYEDENQLLQYCRYSANPVGRILLHLAGAMSDQNALFSDDICTGLQLANFCQDMARDAKLGRIYAPRTLWQRHGVSESMLLAGEITPNLRCMLADWVASTKVRFQRGQGLIDHVPSWFAFDLELFIRGGLAILEKIEKSNFDVWTRRPTVSKPHKAALLMRAYLHRSLGLFSLPPAGDSGSGPGKEQAVDPAAGSAGPSLTANRLRRRNG